MAVLLGMSSLNSSCLHFTEFGFVCSLLLGQALHPVSIKKKMYKLRVLSLVLFAVK